MTLPTTIHAAFLAAIYQIDCAAGGPSIRLQLGVHSAALQLWLETTACKSLTGITAYNPGGKVQADSLNRLAQQALRETAQHLAPRYWEGVNLDPNSHWPAEPCLWLADIQIAQAHDLASHFAQLAFVRCNARAIPELFETQATPHLQYPQ